jgi:chromosome segregation ATPase
MDVIHVIEDLAAIVEFFKDQSKMDDLYKTAIEQAQLAEDERKKAQEARVLFANQQKTLAAISDNANSLQIEKEAFQKVVNDFSDYREKEQNRLNSMNISLDNARAIFNAREKEFSAQYSSFQNDLATFENNKKNATAQYEAMQAKLSALNDEIDRKKAALDDQEKSIQEKFDRLKSIIG